MTQPDSLSTRGIERQRRRMTSDLGEKEQLAQALREGDTETFIAAIRRSNRGPAMTQPDLPWDRPVREQHIRTPEGPDDYCTGCGELWPCPFEQGWLAARAKPGDVALVVRSGCDDVMAVHATTAEAEQDVARRGPDRYRVEGWHVQSGVRPSLEHG